MSFGIKEVQLSWPTVSGATSYRIWESADGVAPMVQVSGDITTSNASRPLALHKQINAQYKVQACNVGGCTDSAILSVSSQLSNLANLRSAIGYVKASNTGENDRFGKSVALSGDGNTLAVWGALEDSSATGVEGDQTDNSLTTSGGVYVFVRSGSNWSQQAYIKASNTGVNDRFGKSLALSADGNTLAVGSIGEDSNATGVGGDEADNSALDSGAVYVFSRNSSTWGQQAYIKASNTGATDRFGTSLALSADGNTLAVGAVGEDSSATGVGGIETDNSATDAGAVYVFSRNSSTWGQQAYIKASNTGATDRFGTSLALSADGNTLAVGAVGEDSNALGIGGNETDNSATDAGAIYVFTRNSSTWDQQAYVKASNTRRYDEFGKSLALSADGNTLAVGSVGEDSNALGVGGNPADTSAPDAGAVFVYSRTGNSWAQQTYVKASNTEAGDRFGTSLALSADGNTLAVGAVGEDSNATGVGGDQTNNSATDSGAVYLF
jgi:hypothetical protein